MRLVAVDWGTTSLRGALLDESGAVLEEQSHARGILSIGPGEFPAVFASLFGEWMRPPGTRCLISGMAGSKQGWIEAPYCECPAGLAEVASKVVDIEAQRIRIVPGLCDSHDGVPDVMRGEEVQVFGAVARSGLRDGRFVLPGTHSKWVEVRDGRIEGFRTFMTGEFYALLSQHSILARTLAADAPFEESAFRAGVAASGGGAGLLHSAFSVRTLALFERLPPAAASSYLSGLLIGTELQAQGLKDGDEVTLIGSAVLAERYAVALACFGARARCFGSEATWAGLAALARTCF